MWNHSLVGCTTIGADPSPGANTLHSQNGARSHTVPLHLTSGHTKLQDSHISVLLVVGQRFTWVWPGSPHLNGPLRTLNWRFASQITVTIPWMITSTFPPSKVEVIMKVPHLTPTPAFVLTTSPANILAAPAYSSSHLLCTCYVVSDVHRRPAHWEPGLYPECCEKLMNSLKQYHDKVIAAY